MRRWYGWQTLIADGLTLGMLAVGAAQERIEDQALYGWLAAVGWLLAPPIIHFAHGNVAEGFGSLGLRFAPVLLGVVSVGECIQGGSADEGSCTALIAVAVVSFPAAVALDSAVFAYDEREERRTATAFSLSIGPCRDARRDAWGVGLNAAF